MIKKKLGVLLSVVLVVILTIGTPSVSFAAQDFTDVSKGSDHYDGIQWLAEKGIKGYEGGSFGTHKPLKRKHAAVMFVEALDLDLPPKDKVTEHFNDVDPTGDHDYAEYIAAVAKKGIFEGKKDGQFNGEQSLTRQQMASTLMKAFKFEAGEASQSINLENVNAAHQDSVQVIADLGITDNLQDFQPRKDITRGQFATFLYRSNEVKISGEALPQPNQGIQKKYNKTSYNYRFTTALNKQMALSAFPQTDGAGGWYDASRSMTEYYLNPKNFKKNSSEYYQFLSLSGSSNVSTKQLNNKVLKGKGILDGRAADFKKASKTHHVNEVYLISHALLETGNGTSALATGVEVGQNKAGNPVRVTKSNRKKLKNIKTTYNFFGIGAVDSAALSGGSTRAYTEGWFTPQAAIVGGAKFVNNNYLSRGQDTIYKMRWNPDRPATHQYATDVGWAMKQTSNIERIYDLLEDAKGAVMNFDVPSYQNQPAAKPRPTGVHRYYMNTNHAYAGQTGIVSGASSLNMRTGPSTSFNRMKALPKGKKVHVIGVDNNGWFKVKIGSQYGWVSGYYIDVASAKSIQSFDLQPEQGEVSAAEADKQIEKNELNQPSRNQVIGEIVMNDSVVYEKTDSNSETIMDNVAKNTRVEVTAERSDWTQITLNGQEGWVPTENVNILNIKTVKPDTTLYETPGGNAVEQLVENATVVIVPTADVEFVASGGWYEVYYNGVKSWIQQDQLN